MKSKLYFFIIATASTLLSVSCGPKEGVLSKNNKIDQIVAVESHYMDTAQVMTTGSYLEQKWNWDGNEVYRIDYHGGEHPYSEVFFYDKRHRIIRTLIPAYNIQTELFYDGRKLDHIDVFDNDELYCKMVYVHDGKTLTEVCCNYYPVSDTNNILLERIANPLTPLVGDDLAECISSENVQRMARQQSKSSKSSLCVRYEFTWVDDNPTKIVCTDGEGTRTISIEYDNKDNPFRQLYGFREHTDPLYGFAMLSHNNIKSIRMPYRNNSNQLFLYRYEYDGDAVSKRRLEYSYLSVAFSSFDTVLYKYEKTEQFSYIDD